MNPDLARLQPYPFQRMAELHAGLTPPAQMDSIRLSIGEPKHPTPAFINDTVLAHLHQLARYPTTRGELALRQAISAWLTPAMACRATKRVVPVRASSSRAVFQGSRLDR